MCENCNDEDCIICGYPVVDDCELGRGCINGACPTNNQKEDKPDK